jgi:drug/metabolite transporter (DMT)-like permease
MKRNLAFLAAFTAAVIYGVSFTVAKEVMPQYIKPFGFIVLRVSGATLLFWFFSLFTPKEKIEKKDYTKFFMAAIFGVALNMLAFFKGLSFTTPINGAVMMLTTPILILGLSAVILKEKITKTKSLGMLLGVLGAVTLIIYKQQASQNGTNVGLGNFLVFVNAVSYALYLVISKPILTKYSPLTFAKWLYLFGLLMVLPFGYEQVLEIQWHTFPLEITLKTLYIVIATTFLTYLFNIIALRALKPTTLSVFIYIQPLVATIYAIAMGKDTLTSVKIIGGAIIFLGVYLVTKKRK